MTDLVKLPVEVPDNETTSEEILSLVANVKLNQLVLRVKPKRVIKRSLE